MSNKIHTRSECRRAAARLAIVMIQDRNGDKRWPLYSVSVYMPHVREAEHAVTDETDEEGNSSSRRKKRITSIGIDRTLAGAMLLAADNSVRDLTAACKRASELRSHWLPFPDAPAFGHIAADLALLMLRNDWRRRLPLAERKQCEVDAEVALRALPLIPYYDDAPDADAIYAAEHAARAAAEYGV